MRSDFRIEKDSLGEVKVPAKRLWAAQTQRSVHYFGISREKMASELIKALVLIKKAAAEVHSESGDLKMEKALAIKAAADEILKGFHPYEFPLSVWQTGSGTQTNMNVNEVIANLASEIMGGERGVLRLIDPNDDVNKGQSSNDVFPTAMSIAAVQAIMLDVLPSVEKLKDSLNEKSCEFWKLTKIGRTHLMDATPLTLGQEISGWVSQLEHAHKHIIFCLPHLKELAIGGTAVGTGLNAPVGFSQKMADKISTYTGLHFTPASNNFEAIAAHDAFVHMHGALKGLAGSLYKIANDVRWLASGPRAAIGEIILPENEPGSSIMPGKVNPTQAEAMMMICTQVMGNDVAINLGGASGNFELNVSKPLIIHNFLQSCRLLSDACQNFEEFCVRDMRPNLEKINQNVENSLMLVTALNPHIGYAKAAEIAKLAHEENMGLKEAALRSGYLTVEEFEKWVNPDQMTNLNSYPNKSVKGPHYPERPN